MGSISARAEEPCRSGRGLAPAGVYLRSRGGTRATHSQNPAARGLSPLARRNHTPKQPGQAAPGSISARAEEPTGNSRRQTLPWVYLRSRGGTVKYEDCPVRFKGLSPLARRNRRALVTITSLRGSISARAEEPFASVASGSPARVYLRSRGGTSKPVDLLVGVPGLSPLARRNLGKRAAPYGA